MTSRALSIVLVMLASIALAAPPGDVRLKPAVDEEPTYRIPPDELVPTTLCAIQAEELTDWGHATLNVPECWKATKGRGATVAVLDTGIDQTHDDLRGQIVASQDFTGSRNGVSDVQGHGTFCAGQIVAAENGTGMIGVAPQSRLIVAKVLGDSGSGSTSGINRGIDWAVQQGADVVSMSLGGPSPDAASQQTVLRAQQAGVIVCAAAGNEGPREGTVGYPGGFPECICVGATDKNNVVASFSSRGPQVFVAAPGVGIRSCYPGNRFATMSGTSMATPYVAAVACLWVAAHPEIAKRDRPAAFRKALMEMSLDLGPAGRDTAYGYGLAQPAKMLGSGQPPMPPPAPIGELTITPDDLTPEARKRVFEQFPGFKDFRIRFEPKP